MFQNCRLPASGKSSIKAGLSHSLYTGGRVAMVPGVSFEKRCDMEEWPKEGFWDEILGIVVMIIALFGLPIMFSILAGGAK